VHNNVIDNALPENDECHHMMDVLRKRQKEETLGKHSA
jgi:hypothetical protein